MGTMRSLDALLALCLALYKLDGGRVSVVLFLFVVYALFLRDEPELKPSTNENENNNNNNNKSLDCNSNLTKPAAHIERHSHIHHGSGRACGNNCTCKNGKTDGKKTLSSLINNRKKQDTAANSTLAVDFTTAFSQKRAVQKNSSVSKGRRVPKLIKSKGAKSKTKSASASSPSAPSPSPSPSLPLSPPSALTKSHTRLVDSNFIVFYSSLTGASERYAKSLLSSLAEINGNGRAPRLQNLDDLSDFDEYFLNTPKDLDNLVYCMVMPSYDIDSPIDYFIDFLKDTYQDFRVDKFPLRKLNGFMVLGLGDSESWADKFCYQAKEIDYWLNKLGGRRLFPLGEVCTKTGGDLKMREWVDLFLEALKDDEPILYEYKNDQERDPLSDAEDTDADADEDSDQSEDTLVDVEDMGKMMSSPKEQVISTSEAKEMVAKNSPTFKNLTKQGYTVVGSHSGVKICRWTKSALRGRGSCYKFAFYGIRSHLCMETTPSLSCSNKCVFCWRHGTNPVGTNWRWKVDKPDIILEGALQGHYSKIKQMRGVPGVVADRFAEAFRVRHCALSLVGEPIFYPYINDFLRMLHEREISSFLVCNAQHPDQLLTLQKVTQLYVSIDAPSKGELKKIDRPLFKDYWERLWKCLDILRTKQAHQRTVFRLTLVKGFNMGDVEGYADMVERARPSLIEIKGATFCGSSAGNGNPLTMQNIPFYEECQNFVRNLNEELNSRGLGYGIAAEHAHSCCILIGSNEFKVDGEWHTHIDYEKFFQLLRSGKHFDKLDYFAKTPDWALWGSESAGFNPQDTRYKRGKKVEI